MMAEVRRVKNDNVNDNDNKGCRTESCRAVELFKEFKKFKSQQLKTCVVFLTKTYKTRFCSVLDFVFDAAPVCFSL